MENCVLSNNGQLITFNGVSVDCGLTTIKAGDFAEKNCHNSQLKRFLNIVGATECLKMKPRHSNGITYHQSDEACPPAPFKCDGILYETPETKNMMLLHCGWKSLLANIIEIAVKDFSFWTRNDTRCRNINAIIYSGICPGCYLVKDDVYQKFVNKSRDYKQFFESTNGKGIYHFNLAGLIKWELVKSGLLSRNVHCFDLCSHHCQLKDLRPELSSQDGNQFLLYSQRRDEEERNFFFAKLPDDKTVITGTTANCPYVILYHNSKK